MNTNNIKYFAQQARLLLLEGVSQRLMYWGFDAKGNNNETLETTHGGYIFRGEIYNDSTVPAKWNALRNRLTDKQAVNDVIEEAAYTWFNRLMAIKILEENQYLDPSLQYAEGVRTPMLVQNAKQGNHSIKGGANRDLLIDLLKNNQEEQAFALLVTNMCNENKLLHDVFGHINDYTELLLPHNLLQKDGLMDLINNGHIEKEDYQEVELIGWLYQFYISDKKDEVFAGFKKNKKARAEDIPAATQIFTPKWIVKYMVENTVGKIYLDYETDSNLRSKMRYLVEQEVEDKEQDLESSDSSPLFPHPLPLINDITELTLLDPACGSGHILVTGFELLFEMYLEVGYTARNAVNNILEHNLFGLDIDDRAMQLARFAVLLKGAELLKGNGSGVSVSREFMTNPTLIPHIYSFAEEQHFESEELQSFLGADGQQYSAELKDTLTLLNQGKNIGSALKIDLSDGAVAHIEKQYNDWKQKQQNSALSLQQTGILNRLQPMLDVLLVLAKKYSSVVANPPYMGQKSMNEELKKYVAENYQLSKDDLSSVFIEVFPLYTIKEGKYAFIVPPSWMFLSSFKDLRADFLSKKSIDSLLYLSRGVFGADFGSMATVIKNHYDENSKGTYFRLVERTFQEIYQGHLEELFLKAKTVNNFKYDFKKYSKENFNLLYSENGIQLFHPNIYQSVFSKISNTPIVFWPPASIYDLFEKCIYFGDSFEVKSGLSTGDNKLFLKSWTEVSINSFFCDKVNNKEKRKGFKWVPYNKGGGVRKWYGNNLLVVNWFNEAEEIKKSGSGTFRNKTYYFRKGITWSGMTSSYVTFRLSDEGYVFDSNKGAMIFTSNSEYLNYNFLSGYLNNKVTNYFLNMMNPGVSTQIGDISKLPFDKFDIGIKQKVALLSEESIKISRSEWDSRETSWDFEQSPILNHNSSLSKAHQQWKKDVTEDFFQLHANEEELNRIFIEIYGLQDELTPDVALKDITILQDELDRNQLEEDEVELREQGLGISRVNSSLHVVPEGYSLPINKEEVISQFISYAIGVFMGRYRLDKPGLNIAHPNATEEETASYRYNDYTIEIDDDGIVPLMGNDCAFPDDALKRTTELVHAIWGEESLTENINFIHNALGMDLHRWLTEKFWPYHVSGKMYKKKPIYWLFSSNVRRPQNAAFKVLVYMHRMNRYTVNKIQRKYLYPHQEYISREIERLVANEANLSRDDLKQLEQLRKWEIECRDYSEVLKVLANKEIAFDLDDGVTENYKLFEGAVANI